MATKNVVSADPLPLLYESFMDGADGVPALDLRMHDWPQLPEARPAAELIWLQVHLARLPLDIEGHQATPSTIRARKNALIYQRAVNHRTRVAIREKLADGRLSSEKLRLMARRLSQPPSDLFGEWVIHMTRPCLPSSRH